MPVGILRIAWHLAGLLGPKDSAVRRPVDLRRAPIVRAMLPHCQRQADLVL